MLLNVMMKTSKDNVWSKIVTVDDDNVSNEEINLWDKLSTCIAIIDKVKYFTAENFMCRFSDIYSIVVIPQTVADNDKVENKNDN